MKKLLIAFVAVTLFAADSPKPNPDAVPVEKQLEIRTAQLQVARLSDALGKLAMQYQSLEKQHTEAQAALTKLVSGIAKPKDCDACTLTDALTWEKPKAEVAKK